MTKNILLNFCTSPQGIFKPYRKKTAAAFVVGPMWQLSNSALAAWMTVRLHLGQNA